MAERQIAEKVRVHLVWICDTSGTFLGSIHATRESAEKEAEALGIGTSVDSEWWVEP